MKGFGVKMTKLKKYNFLSEHLTSVSKRGLCAIIAVTELLCVFAVSSSAEKVEPPSVSAKSAILIEASSGDAVFEQNADEKLPMASTTKIMTAVVALEKSDLTDNVKIASGATGVEGSSIYLKANEIIPMEDLIYALMLDSANDAAAAIAYEVAGGIDEFADLMNQTAERIGLTDSHFANPHGLDDPEHYTTARDLAKLTAYALKNETFANIVSTYKKTIPLNGNEGSRLLLNHNKLLRTYEPAIGVKTGFTKKSGRCLVSAAEQDGITTIAVTLNAPDDWNDHKKMHDYGFSQYSLLTLAEPREIYIDIPCIGGDSAAVRCSNADELKLPMAVGSKVTKRIESDRFFTAPIEAGDALARAVFYCEGQEIASIPLTAEYSVVATDNKPNLFERLLSFLGR